MKWENNTGNDGKILPRDGKILPKHGKILPPKKVFKKVFKKAVSRAQTFSKVFAVFCSCIGLKGGAFCEEKKREK